MTDYVERNIDISVELLKKSDENVVTRLRNAVSQLNFLLEYLETTGGVKTSCRQNTGVRDCPSLTHIHRRTEEKLMGENVECPACNAGIPAREANG